MLIMTPDLHAEVVYYFTVWMGLPLARTGLLNHLRAAYWKMSTVRIGVQIPYRKNLTQCHPQSHRCR